MLRTLTLRRAGLMIFFLSVVVRMAVVLTSGSYRQPVNPVETVLIARSLAAGEGFSNPYGCQTGPTTVLAPVYPFLLSVMYRIFPPGGSRELAIYVLAAVIVSLAYALLPWLAAKMRLDPRAGILAGLAGAAVPLFFWIEITSEWENPLSALLLMVALGLFAGLFDRPGIRQALLAGLAFGAAALTAPTLLPTFLVLTLALIWHTRSRLAAILWPVTALWLPAVLLMTAWTGRNYYVFHELIPIRGGAGLQLHMSFNELSRATFAESAANGAFVDNPHTGQYACAQFAKFGEVEMNRNYQQQAVKWISAHPADAARLIAGHATAFWRMAVPSGAKTLASELLTVLGLLGFATCLRRRAFAARLLGIVLLIYPLVYYINFYDVRYRYPLHPLLLLLTGVLLTGKRREMGQDGK